MNIEIQLDAQSIRDASARQVTAVLAEATRYLDTGCPTKALVTIDNALNELRKSPANASLSDAFSRFHELRAQILTTTWRKSANPRVSVPVSARPPDDSHFPLPKATILLAEDTEPVRELTRLLLERAGYRVFEAPDALAALRIWQEYKQDIHVLFSDVVMPGGIDGLKLAELLLHEKPELNVLITSGYSASLCGQRLQSLTRHIFLPKPYEMKEMLDTVELCLNPGPV